MRSQSCVACGAGWWREDGRRQGVEGRSSRVVCVVSVGRSDSIAFVALANVFLGEFDSQRSPQPIECGKRSSGRVGLGLGGASATLAGSPLPLFPALLLVLLYSDISCPFVLLTFSCRTAFLCRGPGTARSLIEHTLLPSSPASFTPLCSFRHPLTLPQPFVSLHHAHTAPGGTPPPSSTFPPSDPRPLTHFNQARLPSTPRHSPFVLKLFSSNMHTTKLSLSALVLAASSVRALFADGTISDRDSTVAVRFPALSSAAI